MYVLFEDEKFKFVHAVEKLGNIISCFFFLLMVDEKNKNCIKFVTFLYFERVLYEFVCVCVCVCKY